MAGVKTLDRYVLREVLGPFVLGVVILTFALLVARILKLIELMVNHGITLAEVLSLLGYIVPSFLELILPMAVLLGVLLGFGRLSGDSELTAARACGVSLYQLAAPVLAFSLSAYALSSWIAFSVRPWANAELRSELYHIARTQIGAGLKEKVFNKNFPGLVIYVDRTDGPDATLRGVLISDERNPAEPSTIIAKSGLLIPNERRKLFTLRLLDGSAFGLDSRGNSTHVSSFGVYDVTVRPEGLGAYRHDPDEMGWTELLETIAQGRSSAKPDYLAETELASKFTVPMATLLFAVLGVTLGLKPARGGQSERFGLSIALFFIYYILMRSGQSFGETGKVNAFLAMSLPDLVFAIVAGWLFYRSAIDATDQTRGPGDVVWDLVERLGRSRQAA